MRFAAAEDVRRELASWSREELLDFVTDCAAELPAAHDRLRRRVASKGSAAVATFKAQIARALDVREVKWNQVAEFVASLDAILVDVVRLGERQPGEAVEVALWFIGQIPTVVDAVDGEDELANFCTEAASAVALMVRNDGLDRLAVAGRLLDLHAADGYGVASELPGIGAALVTPESLGAFESLFREKRAERFIPELKARLRPTR